LLPLAYLRNVAPEPEGVVGGFDLSQPPEPLLVVPTIQYVVPAVRVMGELGENVYVVLAPVKTGV
jgi:hypothetical protein